MMKLLLDDYFEELEKQARLSPWAVKNLAAPINNTKVLAPVRKQMADAMNRQARQAMGKTVAAHRPIVPSMTRERLMNTAVQSARKTPFSNAMGNLKYKLFEGLQSNGLPHFHRPSPFSFIASGKYLPKPEINLTTPRWWRNQLR